MKIVIKSRTATKYCGEIVFPEKCADLLVLQYVCVTKVCFTEGAHLYEPLT